MKKRKQVRVYSLGGLFFLLILAFIVVVLIVGGFSLADLESCASEGTTVSSVYRSLPQNNVLSDLSRAENFDAANYPEDEDKDELSIIQVAEGTDKRLYVYVYSPKGLQATEIRFSTTTGDDIKPVDYLLILDDKSGALHKYIVEDFTISSELVRYYHVVQLARAWNSDIDGSPTGDNMQSTVPYKVAALFTVCGKDGDLLYYRDDIDVIEIRNPYAGYLRYSDGYHFSFLGGNWQYTDVHYIAFDTDKKIDELQEADVSFSMRTYEEPINDKDSITTYGDPYTCDPITVTGTDKGGNEGGFLAGKYEWERIQQTDGFANKYGITNEDSIAALKKTKWVLMFYETETKMSSWAEGHNKFYRGVCVSDVTILRLKFVTAGVTYNLGAVSAKVTEGQKPGNGYQKSLIDRIIEAIRKVVSFIAEHWRWFVLGLFAVLAIWLIVWLARLFRR